MLHRQGNRFGAESPALETKDQLFRDFGRQRRLLAEGSLVTVPARLGNHIHLISVRLADARRAPLGTRDLGEIPERAASDGDGEHRCRRSIGRDVSDGACGKARDEGRATRTSHHAVRPVCRERSDHAHGQRVRAERRQSAMGHDERLYE